MGTKHSRPSGPRQRADGHTTAGGALVNVPTPAGEVVLVDPRVHREDVVRRLLQLGVSSRTLRALLPAWEELIRSVAATGLAPGSDQPAAATSAELVT